MEKVSSDGVITLEEGKTAETYSEVVEGMQFDRGYITPYMVTDTDKMESVLDDAVILITDKKITNIQEILPVLEQIVNAGKKLLIIAEDIEGEALSTLIVNKLRGTFTCVAVKAPGFGDRRKEMLKDISTVYYDEKAIDEIENVEKTESHTAIMTEATVKDFNGADFSMNTVFYNIDDKRTLNNFEIVNESENDVDNPIYIPLYVSNFGGFALNDEIIYVIDGKYHSFTVAGVIEEMQYGNYGSGLLCVYLPREEFAELADSYSDKAVVEYSMSVKSDASLDEVKDDVSKAIENKGVMALSILDSESVKGTRTMVTDLLVLILAAFALIILAVSVFLSNFKVKNAIESEITNMSVLKALGYTSAQIVASITLPYAIVSLLFAILGIGLSYTLLPVLCSVLTVQSGFSFAVSFDLLSFVCVACILCGVVTFFTFISARKIKKSQPIDGLRGNTSSKHSRKNYFPIEETKGNIKMLLVRGDGLSLSDQYWICPEGMDITWDSINFFENKPRK